jgi:3-oxoacyl-[acyl-carrier-protein] synthase-1
MRDPERQVVVTGRGLFCHMGNELDPILRDLRAGRAKPFPKWAPAVEHNAGCLIAGMIEGEPVVDKKHARFMGRAAKLAYAAARDALSEAKLERRDFAVVLGSGTGDVATHIDVQDRLAKTQQTRKCPPTAILRMMSSTVSATVATALQVTGPSFGAVAACAGGAYNVLLAAMLIEQGHVDSAIAGGVEVADMHFHAGFDAMRAYNAQDNETPERASRPYAADRAGFVFAEGVGVLVLETRKSAQERGAPVLGVIRGWGMSSDGSGDIVFPNSEGAYGAMRRALAHAGVTPEQVDYVNTHGTSTPSGDVSEVKAIRRLMDGRPVRYSSTKCFTGHTISACGPMEAIFTLAMLQDGWVSPALNAEPLDPEIRDYPPVLTPTDARLEIALSNSLGFGGTNVSLVLSRG